MIPFATLCLHIQRLNFGCHTRLYPPTATPCQHLENYPKHCRLHLLPCIRNNSLWAFQVCFSDRCYRRMTRYEHHNRIVGNFPVNHLQRCKFYLHTFLCLKSIPALYLPANSFGLQKARNLHIPILHCSKNIPIMKTDTAVNEITYLFLSKALLIFTKATLPVKHNNIVENMCNLHGN